MSVNLIIIVSVGDGKELTQGRDETNAKTSEETTSEEHGNGGSGSLENDTKVEYPGRDHECWTTTKVISHERASEGAEKCAGGKNRDNGGLLRGGDVPVSFRVNVSGAEEALPVSCKMMLVSSSNGMIHSSRGHGHTHSQDTRDGTSVISEEDTTESNKEAHGDGRPCLAGLVGWLDQRRTTFHAHDDRRL